MPSKLFESQDTTTRDSASVSPLEERNVSSCLAVGHQIEENSCSPQQPTRRKKTMPRRGLKKAFSNLFKRMNSNKSLEAAENAPQPSDSSSGGESSSSLDETMQGIVEYDRRAFRFFVESCIIVETRGQSTEQHMTFSTINYTQ